MMLDPQASESQETEEAGSLEGPRPPRARR